MYYTQGRCIAGLAVVCAGLASFLAWTSYKTYHAKRLEETRTTSWFHVEAQTPEQWARMDEREAANNEQAADVRPTP